MEYRAEHKWICFIKTVALSFNYLLVPVFGEILIIF